MNERTKIKILKLLFFLLFITMTSMILWAIFTGNWDNAISYITQEPWILITIIDIYISFFVFYIWVFFRERNIFSKIIWLLLIISTGSLAITLYVLIQLFKLREGETLKDMISRDKNEKMD
jgi:glucan phosphoethanolaminetransferase (alkaline phosphatase superfamily)